MELQSCKAKSVPIRKPSPPLRASLQRQCDAYLAHPVPTLAERKDDLRRLAGFVQEHKEAICDAISADYGNRSRHETLLLEVMPVVKDVQETLKHLAEWMRPQRPGRAA